VHQPADPIAFLQTQIKRDPFVPSTHVDRGVANNLYFFRSDYSSARDYLYLAQNFHRYHGCDIWVDYFRDHEIIEINRALSVDNLSNKAARITIEKFIKKHSFTIELIDPIIKFFQKAIDNDITICSLVEEEFTLGNFLSALGKTTGELKYMLDKISDDFEACSARWFQRILSSRGIGNRPQILVAPAEHVPTFIRLLKELQNMDLFYVSEGEGRMRETISKRIDFYKTRLSAIVGAEDGGISSVMKLDSNQEKIVQEMNEMLQKLESWAFERVDK